MLKMGSIISAHNKCVLWGQLQRYLYHAAAGIRLNDCSRRLPQKLVIYEATVKVQNMATH